MAEKLSIFMSFFLFITISVMVKQSGLGVKKCTVLYENKHLYKCNTFFIIFAKMFNLDCIWGNKQMSYLSILSCFWLPRGMLEIEAYDPPHVVVFTTQYLIWF